MPQDRDEKERQKGLQKEEAMKKVCDLIAGDKGYDIFRGQPRQGLPLLPKAAREDFQGGDHFEALQRFRRECWAFGLTATRSLEDLAIAQHAGLATYLLDWTTNPLVALFFACGEERDKDANGEIFVLNNPTPVSEEDIPDDKWRDIKGLKLYNPRLLAPGIARQKGLFTIQGVENKPVTALVSSGDLVPHLVAAELKNSLLEVLYTMGIDKSTLFPDPDGLCARINWETRNRISRNFPPVSGSRVVYLEGTVFLQARASAEYAGRTTSQQIIGP
jgi:FRG domain